VMGCPQCRGVDTVSEACEVEGCWNFVPCPEHGATKWCAAVTRGRWSYWPTHCYLQS